MADAAMIPWSPEVLEGAQPVQPAQAFSPLTTVAQGIQELKAKQAELQRARDAEQATLAASAAAQRPKIEAAQTALAQPTPPPPPPPAPPPPAPPPPPGRRRGRPSGTDAPRAGGGGGPPGGRRGGARL